MTEKLIIVDTNAIINLFAGAGEEGWNQLLNIGGGTKVVILQEVLDEVERFAADPRIAEGNIPATIWDSFTSWVDSNSGGGVIKASRRVRIHCAP